MNPFRFGLLIAMAASVCTASAQSGNDRVLKARSACLSNTGQPWHQGDDYRRERIVEDVGTGMAWLVVRNVLHPSSPDRMFPVSCDGFERPRRRNVRKLANLIIHAGDSVIVTDQSLVLYARFQAVALGAAQAAEPVKVRLKIGGQVLQAIATSPGRARLITDAADVHR